MIWGVRGSEIYTHDPLLVKTLITKLEVDLGAEKIIAAEKGTTKIAVEIKSFLGHSTLHDFYKALGQFIFYLAALEEEEPERTLYLAIPLHAYEYLFKIQWPKSWRIETGCG